MENKDKEKFTELLEDLCECHNVKFTPKKLRAWAKKMVRFEIKWIEQAMDQHAEHNKMPTAGDVIDTIKSMIGRDREFNPARDKKEKASPEAFKAAHEIVKNFARGKILNHDEIKAIYRKHGAEIKERGAI